MNLMRFCIFASFVLMPQIILPVIVNFDDIVTRTQINNFGNSFASFVEETSKGKLVVVDFWTDPCPGCRNVDTVIKKLNSQTPYKDNVVFLKIFVKKYMTTFVNRSFYPNTKKVSKVPRVLIFSHGQKVDDFLAEKPRELENKIQTHLQNF